MAEKSINEIAPEQAVQLAQLEKIRLENEKLKLELSEHQKAKPWYIPLIQMVPIITALVALAGFLWGVVQYRDQQDKNRAAQEQQSLREQATAEQEFMKPWLESQREIYLEALSAASIIANSTDPLKIQAATDEFWQLYQGKMILVETRSVSGAMVDFGNCLDDTEKCDKEKMNERCRALASAMAESMAATAKMTYSQFVENQFQYR